MLVSTKVLFKHCYGKFAIGALNIWSMEQTLALFRAGEKTSSPFIVQMTPVARNYAHSEMLIGMVRAAAKIYPKAVYATHIDHGDEMHVLNAIESGSFTSVMIDASHDPFEENVKRTRAIVDKAHEKNISVEAELGVLSGVEDHLSVDEEHALYTQPEEVEAFVGQTNCDSLAVAVGTSHGAYKFSGGDGLQFGILKEIQQKLPGFPLVLHGGSEVNLDDIKRINATGGDIGMSAKGVSPEELMKSIAYGVCKVNIATDARLIWTRVHREFFNSSPELFDPILPGKTYMDELEKFMTEKFELLGSAGKSGQIK
ncbi:MAG: class II fructose-bisphosphate aldolase [Cytophagales bacterium]|nr:class II fructose-bisphosphate aldolase [Cytophagales bacterium]